ncbi:RmlC-like cupin domain-containing protein [Podospora didyma]|uniref:RmlC-like cupin domain-containing protein n=1 Tax=Podospora didyma TaxID=330526 RepID=A0AAE0U179_9PEZI|nr:RmlC-like cupin domain-containing protein [Podospora didyma]
MLHHTSVHAPRAPTARLPPAADRPIHHVPAKSGQVLKMGRIACRIIEDGSNTGNRVGSAEFTVPPGTSGPLAHFHEVHDETFFVTAGTIKFHGAKGKSVVASAGDYVVVPMRAPHAYENTSTDTEAKFLVTVVPAAYINYYRLVESMLEEDEPPTEEIILEAMARFATMPVEGGTY